MLKTVSAIMLTAFFAAGCGGNDDSSCEGCGEYIWLETSQRIVITRNGGLDPQNEIHDYVRDSLPVDAKPKLEQIRVNNSKLECWNDGFTYDIVVTDENGMNHDYFSNNKACNNIEEKSFIETEKIEELISLL